MIHIKIVKLSGNPMPQYATSGTDGIDLRAWLPDGGVTLAPLAGAVIPTGLKMEMPEGWECQIRPSSALAASHGITVLNAPGTIDSDYRGEVGVILVNLSSEPFTIESGERICQMVFAPAPRVSLVSADTLSSTGRGEGGFGHSGRF